MQRRSSRPELLLAIAFLSVWILVPLWGVATLGTVNVQDDIFASDLLNDRLPARAFVGASLARGESPAWMPGIYTGFPSLAQIEVGALYPSNVVLFALLPPYAAIAWAQILPLALAGIGTFLLAAEIGISLGGRLLAAGAFCLSGFLVVHLRQLNMVDAAAWVPLLMLAAERIATGRPGRAPLLLAVAWALELFAGHPQVSYYTALVLGAYFLARFVQSEAECPPLRRLRAVRLARFALPLLLGTLVAAVQLLPTAELARLTYREGGISFADASQYAVSPLSAWTFFVPGLFGDARTDSFRLSGLFWEQYGYIGLLPVLLAVIAVVVERRRFHVRFLAALALASYLLVLGRNTPVFRWAFDLVPAMGYFRFPSRFLLFVDLALALLAGFGLAACAQAAGKGVWRRVLVVAVLAVTAIDLWVHQMRQVPQVEMARWIAPIDTVRILSAARREHPEPWRYYTLDASLVHGQVYHGARGWSGDLTPYLRLRALLQPSFNLLFGLETPDGYSNLVPRYYEAIWGSEKKRGIVTSRHLETGELEPKLAAMLRLFNVRYVLSVMPLRSPLLRRVARSAEGVEVYEVADPLPRAFVVGATVATATDDEAIARLTSPGFDVERQAVVDGAAVALPADAASSRNVELVRRTNTEAVFRVRIARPGLLVVSEGYYPGWRATIDAAPAPLLRVDVMMRGVVVPAGDHTIAFRFRSPAIRAGLLISLAAVISLVAARRRLEVRSGG